MNKILQTASTQKEKQAIKAFLNQLLASCKTKIIKVYLFGSQARGEMQKDSDIDILVIAAQSDWHLKHQISHIAADIGLEYDVLIDSHIVQESRWQEIGEAGYRFYKNVMDEGILLIASVTDDLVKRGIKAGDLVKFVAKPLGGGGGGKPTLTQVGGKDASKLKEALGNVAGWVEGKLKV